MMNHKTSDILRAIGFLAVIAIFIWSISNIIEMRNRETVQKLIKDNEEKERIAQREREKISYDNFILSRKFDSLNRNIEGYEVHLIGIKKDYSAHLEHFNTIKNEEKKFIPSADFKQQLDVISTVKYNEFR